MSHSEICRDDLLPELGEILQVFKVVFDSCPDVELALFLPNNAVEPGFVDSHSLSGTSWIDPA